MDHLEHVLPWCKSLQIWWFDQIFKIDVHLLQYGHLCVLLLRTFNIPKNQINSLCKNIRHAMENKETTYRAWSSLCTCVMEPLFSVCAGLPIDRHWWHAKSEVCRGRKIHDGLFCYCKQKFCLTECVFMDVQRLGAKMKSVLFQHQHSFKNDRERSNVWPKSCRHTWYLSW